MLRLKDLLLEKKTGFSKCSTQIQVPEEISGDILRFGDMINFQDINNEEGGKESDIHITVLYGIKDMKGLQNIQKSIREISKKIQFIEVKLGNVTSFEDNPKFDVLKIDVESPELVILNKIFRKITDYENKYPYNPHVTIAYLNKGCAKKYINDDRFEGKIFKVSEFYFCNMDGQKTKISLENNLNENEEHSEYTLPWNKYKYKGPEKWTKEDEDQCRLIVSEYSNKIKPLTPEEAESVKNRIRKNYIDVGWGNKPPPDFVLDEAIRRINLFSIENIKNYQANFVTKQDELDYVNGEREKLGLSPVVKPGRPIRLRSPEELSLDFTPAEVKLLTKFKKLMSKPEWYDISAISTKYEQNCSEAIKLIKDYLKKYVENNKKIGK